MARDSYNIQLKEMKNQMAFLSSMVETAVQDAISALINQDTRKAEETARKDDKIDEQVRFAGNICYNLLLRQQPVARDLREVSAVLKMLADMERIGGHAEDISELVILMAGSPYPGEIHYLEKMAKEVTVMLSNATEAYTEADSKKAMDVIAQDDTVDALFDKAKDGIAELIRTGQANAEQALDILMTAKYFERIGGHAANIAEQVLFLLTGELPGC